MAKELTLQEVVGNGAAIDRNERTAGGGLRRWIARAMSSLPVPVSPRTRTSTFDAATCSTSSKTRRMDWLRR